ncbi:MAG: TIM barrel protein [Thermoflexales bacterium]
MYKNLNLGLLGHPTVSFSDTIDLARRHGFAGVDLDLAYLDTLVRSRSLADAVAWFAATHLRAGTLGLSVAWRESDSDAAFEASLRQLEAEAALARAFGCQRCVTWVMPRSSALSYRQHFARIAPRLARAAATLAGHGIRLGLEFIGPATLRSGQAHDFIHTMDGMRAFNCAVGGEPGNVGLLLDAFHWWTSHGTAQELRHLENDEIVYVHVNDGQAGLDRDAQVDQARAQVGATGVIPIKTFLAALRAVGYDGPVAVEPFNAAIKAMTPEDAVRATSAALDQVFALSV